MVDLKEKKRANDYDRFKPVVNPNYKPPENKNQTKQPQPQPQVTNSIKNTDDIAPTDSIYQINTPLPSSLSSSLSSLPSKISAFKPNASQTETSKDDNAHTNTSKSNNTRTTKPLPLENIASTVNSPRISPLYSISPESIVSNRKSSSVQMIPPPLPTSPRPSTASEYLNHSQEQKENLRTITTEKKKEERWTISSTRRLDTLPVKVNNPKINNRSSRSFLSNPLPTPPKHTDFRTFNGFGNQEYTANDINSSSLIKQPSWTSWTSDQSYKWNQSQQNERPFEITQNK